MPESPEKFAAEIKVRHGLSSLHLFTERGRWRVFGFRLDAKGYQASSESGTGPDILSALSNLNDRLIEGPIHPKA